MDPYYIFSFLFGISSKLFDDIIDNPKFRAIFGNNAHFMEEVFKAGMYSFNTLIIQHNPIFGLFFILLSITMIFGDNYIYNENGTEHKAFDNQGWWGYFIITTIITLLSFIFFESSQIHYPFFILFTLIVLLFGFIIEPFLIPENNSSFKTKFRAFVVLLIPFFLYNKDLIQKYIPMDFTFYFYFITFVFSYFLLSVIINTLYPYNQPVISNKPNIKPTHTLSL
jgi:hypothetical protein